MTAHAQDIESTSAVARRNASRLKEGVGSNAQIGHVEGKQKMISTNAAETSRHRGGPCRLCCGSEPNPDGAASDARKWLKGELVKL